MILSSLQLMRVHSHEEIQIQYEKPQMTDISVVGPDSGEQMLTGPVRMRILEDGSTTGHRLGIGEITIAPHTYANPGDEFAVLLNTFTPDLYVQYFRDLRDMIAAGQPLTGDAVAGVMARYDTVPATDFASQEGP